MSESNQNPPSDSLAGAKPAAGPGGTAQRIIAGFEILSKVGQGGMGAVFRARQISMDRIVALKILPKRLAQDPKYKERFLREARLSAKLNHVNLINGIECGEDGGYMFYAMEFVEGVSSRKLLADKGKLPIEEACAITMQMAEALAYAHSKQLIHRDVKPDNVMIAPSGTAKLCDLGLARSMEVKTDASLTQAGEAVGTPFYISPEQARGEDVDPRTDMYSLGATFYHFVSGRPPFEGTTSASIMVKHLTETAPALTEVCPDIQPEYGMLVAKMMAKSAADRYASMTEVLDDFKAIKAGDEPAAMTFNAKSSCATPLAPMMGTRRTTGPRRAVAAPSQVRQSVRAPKPASRGIPLPALAAIGVIAVAGLIVAMRRDSTATVENSNGPVAAAPAKPDSAPKKAAVAPVKPKAIVPTAKVDSGTPPAVPVAPTVAAAPAVPPVPATVPVGAPVVAAPETANAAAQTPPQNPDVAPKPEIVAPAPTVVADASPAVENTAAKTAEPAPPRPEQKIDLARTKFLSEMVKRVSKADMVKVEKELRDLSLQSEFSPARNEIRDDLKDFELAVKFEQAGLEAIGKSKGTLDLPKDHALRKLGADKVKVEGFDKSRGLFVTAGGARMPLAATAIDSKKLSAAALTLVADAASRFNFHLARGELDEAQTVVPLLTPEQQARAEQKLALMRVGDVELAAQAEYAAILQLWRAKQWRQFVDKLIVFQTLYANTEIVKKKSPELAAMREFAEDLLNPYKKIFAAPYIKQHPGGFIELHYDFTTPEQLVAFSCDHGTLSVADGWLVVPPGATEMALARFVAPIAEIRAMEATGKSMIRAPRFGIWLISPAAPSVDSNPRVICRNYNMRAHVENFEPPYVNSLSGATTNALASRSALWSKDTTFVVDGAGKEQNWKVNDEELGKVKVPDAAIGAQLCFVSVGGDHQWTNFKIVFKPDPNWVKTVTGKSNP